MTITARGRRIVLMPAEISATSDPSATTLPGNRMDEPRRLRAYKTELNPTYKQAQKMRAFVGAVQCVYNDALRQRIHYWDQDRGRISAFDQMKELTEAIQAFPFLGEVPREALNAAIQNLDRAFAAFFRRVKQGQKPGFPRFKSRYSPKGFKFFTAVSVREGSISLPKLGWVKLHEEGYLPVGRVKIASGAVTLRGGRWFVSITVEADSARECAKDAHDVVGVDLGLKEFLVCSDGRRFENPRHAGTQMRKLRRLQRAVSRKPKGSRNRRKAQARVSGLHMDVGFSRSDYLHKITTELAQRKSVVVIEDLNVAGMIRCGSLSSAIADVAWSEFRRQLEYKAQWYGCRVVVADRFFPSSKTCSVCGHVYDTLKLSERKWTCAECGATHDRDFNAAVNLEKWYREPRGNQSQSVEANASEGVEIHES